MCVCSHSYPAWNAHTPYYHVCSDRVCRIVPHYLITGTIFEKKNLLSIKCIFRFYLQIMSGNFLIVRRDGRDMIKNVYWSSCTVSAIRARFNETLIYLTDFRKIPKYQISRKSAQWKPSCSMQTDGQDRHDEASSRF
jgi:hypothetical protein